jgi:hypothetical protein
LARGGNTYPTRQRAAGVGEASQDMTTNLSWAAKRATGMANSVEANERRLRRESPIIHWDKAIANLLDILDDEPPPAQPERRRNGPPAPRRACPARIQPPRTQYGRVAPQLQQHRLLCLRGSQHAPPKRGAVSVRANMLGPCPRPSQRTYSSSIAATRRRVSRRSHSSVPSAQPN